LNLRICTSEFGTLSGFIKILDSRSASLASLAPAPEMILGALYTALRDAIETGRLSESAVLSEPTEGTQQSAESPPLLCCAGQSRVMKASHTTGISFRASFPDSDTAVGHGTEDICLAVNSAASHFDRIRLQAFRSLVNFEHPPIISDAFACTLPCKSSTVQQTRSASSRRSFRRRTATAFASLLLLGPHWTAFGRIRGISAHQIPEKRWG
jgi:hypothetical protein